MGEHKCDELKKYAKEVDENCTLEIVSERKNWETKWYLVDTYFEQEVIVDLAYCPFCGERLKD